MDYKDMMVSICHVSKEYRLGAIGGTTLKEDLSRLKAKIFKQPDPTLIIGQDQYCYGKKFMALQDISFDVYKGEAIGIIGSNGAGKSTLLKLLSRVTSPTSGYIGLNGKVASMLEVGTGFHPELTGRENIYMNGAILGMSRAEINSKIEQIIDFSECRYFIDTPVKRYSSGMYVKLAFSVAAHLDSDIMIMDEVLAVGDMKFQQKCLSRMGDASSQEGRTILYVSHNMNTIRQLCSRCVVLGHGKIVFDGDVEQAIETYMDLSSGDRTTDIDLSEKRMAHLSPIIRAKILHLSLSSKDVPVYEFGEQIKFDLTIKANEKIPRLSIRIEIRCADGNPIATSILQDFFCLEEKSENVLSFCINPTGLVPSKYLALLVIYNVNDMGTYDDLDAVYPAFCFEIQDTKNNIKINWNNNAWGKIKWRDISFLGKK